jgi:hypothetical protein
MGLYKCLGVFIQKNFAHVLRWPALRANCRSHRDCVRYGALAKTSFIAPFNRRNTWKLQKRTAWLHEIADRHSN